MNVENIQPSDRLTGGGPARYEVVVTEVTARGGFKYRLAKPVPLPAPFGPLTHGEVEPGGVRYWGRA